MKQQLDALHNLDLIVLATVYHVAVSDKIPPETLIKHLKALSDFVDFSA